MKEKCPHCGASLKSFWHTLTPGLVATLRKFIEAVKSKGMNKIHLQKDMSLSKNEYNNFQKLRYFGLVAKCKDEKGSYLITRNGGSFLRNKLAMPKKIQTFRNKIVAKLDVYVKISDFYKGRDEEYWEKEFCFDIFQGKLL